MCAGSTLAEVDEQSAVDGGSSYWLHMELATTLLVAMSTQLFTELSSAAPQPLLVSLMADTPPDRAELVIRRLLLHYVARHPPPGSGGGIFSRALSAAGYAARLP